MYGDFSSDKLKVAPFEPWRASDIAIPVSSVTGMSLPAKSESQVAGIIITANSGYSDYAATADGHYAVYNSIAQDTVATMGGFVDFADKLEGYIQIMDAPAWLYKFLLGEVNGDIYSDQNRQNDDDIEAIGGKEPAVTEARLEFIASAKSVLNAYATDMFWKIFRKDVQVGINFRFMLHYNNVSLRPGRIISVLSESGKTVMTCYIIAVKHIISVENGTAQTSISGAYVRSGEGVSGIYDPKSPVVSEVYAVGGNENDGADSAQTNVSESKSNSKSFSGSDKEKSDTDADKLYKEFKPGAVST